MVLIALIVTLVMIFGHVQPFKFPEAEPWWTHGLVYQIHVPTFANDAGGSLGRLKDVSSRMVYLADKVGLKSISTSLTHASILQMLSVV